MPRRLISVDDAFNIPDSVNVRDVNLPDNLQPAALTAAIDDKIDTAKTTLVPLKTYEGVPLKAYGSSSVQNNGTYTPVGTEWFSVAADRLNFDSVAGYGIGGSIAVETAWCLNAGYGHTAGQRVLNTKGIYGLYTGYNDRKAMGTNPTETLQRYKDGIRYTLALMEAKGKVSANGGTGVTTNGTWTLSAMDATKDRGARAFSSVNGDYIEYTVSNENRLHIVFLVSTTQYAQCTISVNGVTKRTLDFALEPTLAVTRSAEGGGSTTWTQRVVTLEGLGDGMGSGSKTIRITKTGGGTLSVQDFLTVQNNRPPVYFFQERLPAPWNTNFAVHKQYKQAYRDANNTIAQDFPAVRTVDISELDSITDLTLVNADGTHLLPPGHAWWGGIFADQLQRLSAPASTYTP